MVQKYFFRHFYLKSFPMISNINMFWDKLKISKFRSFRSFFTLFGPFFGPKRAKWPEIIFFVILVQFCIQRGVTCLCFENFNFSVPKRVVGPKFQKTGIFGKNLSQSFFFKYHPLTSCQKLEKSLEPFSGNMGITLFLGPFWVILGHFGTVMPKSREREFFRKNAWERFLPL